MDNNYAEFEGSLNNNQRIQQKQFENRDHLVVPAVLVQEQVLNGEFLPADEIQRSIRLWEGVPVTVPHPKQNGQPVTARSVSSVERFSIGEVHNVEFEDNKLKGDLFIDLTKVDNVEHGEKAEKAVENIKEETMVDVSTGYFAETEEKRGRHNGNQFEGIQRNLEPDHLALLPNSVGACSLEDGCGAPRVNILSTSRTADSLEFSDTESSDWSEVSKGLQDYIGAYFEHTDNERSDFDQESFAEAQGLPQEIKTWISQQTLLGDSGADNVRDLIFFPVINQKTNNLNENALMAVISGRGEAADIDEQAKTSAQGAARNILETMFDRDLSDNSNMMEDDEMEENEVKGFMEHVKAFFNQEDDDMAEGDDEQPEENEEDEQREEQEEPETEEINENQNNEQEDSEMECMSDEMAEVLNELDADELEGAVEQYRQQKEKQQKRHEELVDELNEDLENFDEDELTDMSVNQLENIKEIQADRNGTVNYVGKGAPEQNEESDDNEVPKPKPVILGNDQEDGEQ